MLDCDEEPLVLPLEIWSPGSGEAAKEDKEGGITYEERKPHVIDVTCGTTKGIVK